MSLAWTEHAACAWITRHESTFRSFGWLVCLYGGTLKGTGRDLDLICVPWRQPFSPSEVIRCVFGQTYYSEITPIDAERFCFTYQNRLYDIQFRGHR